MSGPPNVTETVFAAIPIGGARSALLASPYQFLMTGEDNLLVTAWTDTGGYGVNLTGRFLKATGEIIPFNRRLEAGLTTAGAELLLNLGPGFLLNLSMISIFPGVQSGRIYARLDVVRGSIGARIVLGTLLAGYVTSVAYLAWPGSQIVNPWEGPSYVRRISLGSPGAGVTPSLTAGALQRYHVLAAAARFITDADAQSNRPLLQLARLGAGTYPFYSSRTHNSNESVQHCWTSGYGGGDQIAPGAAHNALPLDVWVLPTDILTFTSTGFDAGDEFQNAELVARQYLDL